MATNTLENEIKELRQAIIAADKAYYVDALPLMSDAEYDKLFDRLKKLEADHPELADPHSPISRIGSDIDQQLPEREHLIPILSLDKCYQTDELMDWIKKNQDKCNDRLEVIIEPKIDGAGVVLYYENGKLDRALTRGNGYIGNVITDNVKTIHSVPLVIGFQENLAVRGEVYIKKEEFKEFNEKYAEGKYSNPRNLASASIRRQKSREAAMFPLNIFIYEGYYPENRFSCHLDILLDLKGNGFALNDYLGYFSNHPSNTVPLPFQHAVQGTLKDIPDYLGQFTVLRKSLPYEIDGLVIKINDLKTREELGYTQHHPRWAIAYKFNAPLAETIIRSIDIQIGRGGRVTPVANLDPVELLNTTISRATLHNQDYIDSLSANEGDRVSISKRGDVIPAVEEVIEKGSNVTAFKIQSQCPLCQTDFVQEGAHLFCPNEECPGRLLGTLQYFSSRGQMDIESLGDKTLEFLFNQGYIRYIPDIYEFDFQKLLGHEGFKEKKIQNMIEGVNKSRQKNFPTVLASLGLKDIGNKAAEILATHFKTIDAILAAAAAGQIEILTGFDGIGESIARSIISHFTNPRVIGIIERLKKAGLTFEYNEDSSMHKLEEQFLTGTRWVITGSFMHFKPREKAGELIKAHGGVLLESVSAKVTHLLCGESPGSKREKAVSLGIQIISEEAFLQMINRT